jgi:hypothetical protein
MLRDLRLAAPMMVQGQGWTAVVFISLAWASAPTPPSSVQGLRYRIN